MFMLQSFPREWKFSFNERCCLTALAGLIPIYPTSKQNLEGVIIADNRFAEVIE
jgi:hypothetical protein